MTNEISQEKLNRVFDSHYFYLNKKLQIVSGLWPYQSRKRKFIHKLTMLCFLGTALVFLLNGLRHWCGVDIDVCGENLVGLIYVISVLSKLFITSLYEEKFKIIYTRLAINWLELTDPQEHNILISFARQAKIKTVVYFVYMAAAGVGFCQIPMIPVFLDFINPLNETRPKILFVKAEFIFDPYKYFYQLYAFFIGCAASAVFIVCSIDTTFTAVVHQIIGVVSIIKYRLNCATVSFNPNKDVSYKLIVHAIQLHKEVLQFSDLIEKSYNIFFLVLTGLTVVFLSTGAIVMLVRVGAMLDLIRLVLVLIGAILHFLFLTWPGQNLIDHTSDLFAAIYATEWYNVSERSKKLLSIIMLRSLKPCVFTAGGLYVMNLENFGSIMKTAVSYMAVVSSFR
ncbi:odorant receptor 147 [Nasonia vitripennis]|uniref:Odorant receptor n=1 Tax=Nasonia vitripennis TaxID=7425 RepID=A0A7M6UE03_NASVI|nr:odorant receptor 147 [Nasonia vitripennis]